MLSHFEKLHQGREAIASKINSDQKLYTEITQYIWEGYSPQESDDLNEQKQMQRDIKRAWGKYLVRSQDYVTSAQSSFHDKLVALSNELEQEGDLKITLADWLEKCSNEQIPQIRGPVIYGQKLKEVLGRRGVKIEFNPSIPGGSYSQTNEGILVEIDSSCQNLEYRTEDDGFAGELYDTLRNAREEMDQMVIDPNEPLTVTPTEIVMYTTIDAAAPDELENEPPTDELDVGFQPNLSITYRFRMFVYIIGKIIASKKPNAVARFFSDDNDGSSIQQQPHGTFHSALDFLRIRFKTQQDDAPFFIPNPDEWLTRVTNIVQAENHQPTGEVPSLLHELGFIDRGEQMLLDIAETSHKYLEGYKALPFLPLVCGFFDQLFCAPTELFQLAQVMSLLVQLSNQVGVLLPLDMLSLIFSHICPSKVFLNTARCILRFSQAHLDSLSAQQRTNLEPLNNFNLFPTLRENLGFVQVNKNEAAALGELHDQFFDNINM